MPDNGVSLAADVELIATCDAPYATKIVSSVVERPRFEQLEVAETIISEWDRYATAQRSAGRMGHLVNAPLFRYEGFHYSDDCLSLSLSQTDYREVYGTNIRNPDFRGLYGDSAMGNALGICAAIRTSDHSYVVFERSADVLELPGFFHLCAGHFERGKQSVDVTPNIVAAMMQEIREELRLDVTEIVRVGVLGLCRSLRSFKPEVLFAVDTSLTASDLSAPGRLNFEHKRLFCVGTNDAIAFLRAHWSEFVPAGKAALLLRVKSDHGSTATRALPILPFASG